jgi:hypothetical protein
MSWPAWAAEAATLDPRALLPVVRLAAELGVAALPASLPPPYDVAAWYALAANGVAALGVTPAPGPAPAGAPPEAEVPAVAAPPPAGESAAAGAVPFTARDAWLEPWTYGLADGKYARGLPLHFRNWLVFEPLAPEPWVGDWRARAEEARGSYASQDLPPVDRELQADCYKTYRAEKEFYAWEQEQGLIPDVALGHESDIKFEGRKLFTAGYSHTDYTEGNASGENQPGSDVLMEGELQLRIEGTIMRKTHVYVDYDDTRENESRNQVSVVYKGDPDELVQEAAFGDIILSLPSTEFVSYSSTRAVFGAKVDLKYKWAELMAIASREKGKTEKATFTGGSELTSLNVDDTAYARRKFYLLNTAHDAAGNDFFATHEIYRDTSNQPKVEIFVLPTGSWPQGTTRYYLNAYEYDDATGYESGGERQIGGPYISESIQCKKLARGTDYAVDVETGIICLNVALNKSDKLAAAYIVADATGNVAYRIGYNDDNKLAYHRESSNAYRFDAPLKCIKDNTEKGDLQRYEQKNFYNMGSTNIRSTSLIVKVFDTNKSERNADGETYLHTLGLDRGTPPDGRVDAEFIDYANGYIIVPDVAYEPPDRYKRRDDNRDGYYDNLPFDYDGNGVVEGIDAYPVDTIKHKYTLYFEYQSLKPSYFLQPNIIPGSETVRLNGVTLTPNRDYWIDYDSGFLELLTEEAEDPTAVLDVTYEYKPLFELMTKSLVGGRFQFGPDDDRHIGTTYIAEFSSKPPKGQTPSLAEVPTNQQIFDVDARWRVHPEWMTKAADAFPGAHTREESTFDLQGEYARSVKDVNTVGTAFVDDMEDARLLSSITMKYQAWRNSSPPGATGINQGNRGDKLLRLATETGHVFSEVDPDWPKDMLELLQVTNLPDNPEGESGKTPFKWGAIHRILSPAGTDFTEGRYEYVELMLNLNNLTESRSDDDVHGGILHLDLGSIDEDTDTDAKLHTEDKNQDGRLDTGEDVGITFDNTLSAGHITALIGANNQILDTEDDNRNYVLDTENDYFTYAIDLEEVIDGQSPYIIRGPRTKNPLEPGWYILRVPLDFENADQVGAPDASRVVSYRMWFEAETAEDFPRPGGSLSSVFFGTINFGAMRWDPPVVTPETGLNEMKILTKDSRHDADYKPLSPTTDVETGTTEKEQALVMQYILTDWRDEGVAFKLPSGGPTSGIVIYGAGNGIYDTEDANHNGILDPGEDIGLGPQHYGANNGVLDEEAAPEGYTRKTNNSAEDFTRYRRLDVYIYNVTPQDNGGADSHNDVFFLRFGSDEDNYYEYVTQLPGQADWRLVSVDLERFLALHAKGQPFIARDADIVAGHYRIVGDPSLLNIMEVVAGVRTKVPREGGSGGFVDYREVWVNNITLTLPEDQVGGARRVKTSFDFGNFIKFGGGYRNVDGGFEELGSTSTARSATTSADGNATLELAKFMPDPWNVRLPLYGYVTKSETITEDKYDPKQSIYSQGRTVGVTRRIGLSFDKYKLPSWDLEFKNSDSINYKYARTTASDTYRLNMDYEIYPRRTWLPANVRSNFDRRFDTTVYGTKTQTDENRAWITDDSRSSVKFEPLPELELTPSYNYGYTRDRADRTEESFDETYGFKTQYYGVKGLRPNANYTSTYRETVEVRASGTGGTGGTGGAGAAYGPDPVTLFGQPRLGPDEAMTLSLSADYNVSVPVELGKLTGDRTPGINKWTCTPGFDQLRSSSYDDLRTRPGWRYRVGRDYVIQGIGAASDNFVSSRLRNSFTLKNRLNPFEFLGLRKGTKWENWDFIQADVDYAYSNELSNTTGGINRTITTTFPDLTFNLYGTKNFPLVAEYLDRSTVVLTYNRRKTYQDFESLEYRDKPGVSWRATWTRTFRTRSDYYYTRTKTAELDPDTDQPTGVTELLREKNPSLTLYYDLAMPRGFKVPLLGTIRWRNELNLTAGVDYTQVRGENSSEDDSNEIKYTLSGGYYVTTNLHADVTGSLAEYRNLSEEGQDYTTVGVTGNFEIIF